MVAEQYYKPSQIRYHVDDMIWVIAVVLPHEAGYWPPEHGLQNTGGQRSPSQVAPFENPAIVRAEVTERLKLTKGDGETLLWEIQNGGVEYYPVLCPAARQALLYISSGWKRRQQTYAQWKSHRKATNKVFAVKG
jgi:hypothetical protein